MCGGSIMSDRKALIITQIPKQQGILELTICVYAALEISLEDGNLEKLEE